MRVAIPFLLCVAALGCSGTNDDHVLTVTGTITDQVAPAIDVTVRASCGPASAQVAADSNGQYSLKIDTRACATLALEFHKESYLPVLRVLPLPAPTSPLTLDVKIAPLSELRCGSANCVMDGGAGAFPANQFARGFATTMSGVQALDFVGGEYRDDQSHIIWVDGFGYFDFRDQAGNLIAQFDQGFVECLPVDMEAQKWLVDNDPTTDKTVELSLYDLDSTSGRWVRRDEPGLVNYTTGTHVDPVTMATVDDLAPLAAAQLPDVISNQFGAKSIWLCAPVRGSGWLAWGRSLEPTSCVEFEAQNNCMPPGAVKNAVLDLHGRGFGFRAGAWTDANGKACVEIAPSEPTGQDYDGDHNSGETFFIDFTVSLQGSSVDQRASFESPRTLGSCAQPASCYHPSLLALMGASCPPAPAH